MICVELNHQQRSEHLKQQYVEDNLRRGERTEPCGTPLGTGKEAEVVPSAMTDVKQLDKELEVSLREEGAEL